MTPRRLCAMILVLAACSGAARAHSVSTSYLDVATAPGNQIDLSLRVALRDVDALLDLDADRDGELTWGEVEDRSADIAQLAARSLVVASAAAECPLTFDAPRFERLDSSGFLRLAARAQCAQPPLQAEIGYRLFAGIDPTHRALATVPGAAQPALLAPGDALAVDFGPRADRGTGHSFGAMLADGAQHILAGFDHVLFLVALMLPAMLERHNGRWVARSTLRAALVQVAWIVTAFTVAHSITLALASFDLVRVPANVIEPLIAITVLGAALNSLWPLVTTRLPLVAFGFGLIHGFGFASVLAPLHLAPWELARALLAFNLGVEAGQLALVAAGFAVLAGGRHWHGYPRWVLGGGSVAVALTACAWILERVFDVPFGGLSFAAAS